jgi:hypothetical protein
MAVPEAAFLGIFSGRLGQLIIEPLVLVTFGLISRTCCQLVLLSNERARSDTRTSTARSTLPFKTSVTVQYNQSKTLGYLIFEN